jgi:cytochrome P450
MSAVHSDLTESFWDTTNSEPYPFYERVRGHGEVVWDPAMKAWLVVSAAAARKVLQDDALFLHPVLTMQAGETYKQIRGNNPRSFFFLQGEKHREMHRWWVRDLLSPQWVARYRADAVGPVINRLLDGLAARDRFELSSEYAERIPVGIFAVLLDLPRQHDEFLAHIKQLNDHIAEFVSLAHSLRLEADTSDENKATAERAVAAALELDEILRPVVAQRRAGTGQDLISRLWAGGPQIFPDWNETDTLDGCRRLLFAGVDTTTHLVANAYHMLLSDADLLQRVRHGDEKTVERFAEEALRLNGTVQFRPRRAMADTEVAGVPIRKGDMVVVILMAANRDPEQFACPHAVDLERAVPRHHLAFLYGPRACPGATLARAELVEAVSAGLRRFPHLRLDPDAEPPVFRGFMMRSHRPLHVRTDAR